MPIPFGVRQGPLLSALEPSLPDPATAPPGMAQRFAQYVATGRAAIHSPWVGITTAGTALPGLFPVGSTGVSTAPIRAAAEAWLECLDPAQRARAVFPVDDPSWRAWSNIHVYTLRHGVLLNACSASQRERGLDVLRATLSLSGFQSARDVMRLNDALAELTGRPEEYGEWYYWLSVFGQPSSTEPWGWQIDGHHLAINCFVLGEQVVMTPAFMGSEPTAVETGRHAGTRVFAAEEARGLEVVRSLSRAERAAATPFVTEDILRIQRMDGRIQTAAFRDNIQLGYAGVRADALSQSARRGLEDLIELYVGRLRPDHAAVHMEQIRRHLAETHFLWVGELEDDSVFYYRIHSPVILVEFDHLNGIAFDNDQPSRNHIHTVVRTPNGNDYGRDLLRQHYARHHRHRQHETARA